MSLRAKFVLLQDTTVIKTSNASGDFILPAGCLVEEMKSSEEANVLQLETLEAFSDSTDGNTLSKAVEPLRVRAPLNALLEVSMFSVELLKAERNFTMRLIVCRDENWLEEATSITIGAPVFVMVGQTTFRSVVQYVGPLPDKPGKWFGVELAPSRFLKALVPEGTNGLPYFECEPGRGLLVTISSLRLAEVTSGSFTPRVGLRKFSARTTKAAVIRTTKTCLVDEKTDRFFTNKVELKSAAVSVPVLASEEVKRTSVGVGDRVVWFPINSAPVRGKVVYNGKAVGYGNAEKFGLRLDERKGIPNFIGEIGGKDLFHCGPGYGALVDRIDLTREDEYDDAFTSSVPCSEAGVSIPFISAAGHSSTVPDKPDSVVPTVQTTRHDETRENMRPKPGTSLKEQKMYVDHSFTKGFMDLSFSVVSSTTAPPAVRDDGIVSYKEFDHFKLGERVAVLTHVGQLSGTLRWIGAFLLFSKEVIFGVDLDKQFGSPENVCFAGTIGNEQLGYYAVFDCKPGHGKFVSKMDLVRLEEPRKSDQSAANNQVPLLPEDQFPRFVLGQRVGTVINNQVLFGIVQWTGIPIGESTNHVGLSLDKIVQGAPGGSINGQKYFDAASGYGVIVPASLIIHARRLLGTSSPVDQVRFDPGSPLPTEDEIMAVVRETELKERSLADRKSDMEVFRELAEQNGLSVTVNDKPHVISGFVKFLPKPFNYPYYVTRITVADIGDFPATARNILRTVVREVEHFPPLFLHFELPHGFPQTCPPVYKIECNWLPTRETSGLIQRLVLLWKQYRDLAMPNLLYECIAFVRRGLLKELGIGSGLTYLSKTVAVSGADELRWSEDFRVYDTDAQVVQVFGRIVKFNEKLVKDDWEKNRMECCTCLNVVSPEDVSEFSSMCDHMFCRSCITNHVKAQLENGNRTAIRCLGDGCKVEASFLDLADLISPDLLAEINYQLLDISLAGMKDIRRCPGCGYPVIFEKEMIANDRYIRCPQCKTDYCPQCKGKSHGDQPCMTFEQKRELRNRYQNATVGEKGQLEQQYGLDNIKHAVEDYEAEEFIRTHGKPCPNCNAPTEKTAGCNHMQCTRCNTHFCYICGAQISKTDPYSHFNGQTRCTVH